MNNPNQRAAEDVSQRLVSEYITGSIERRALAEALATVRSEQSQLENNLSLIPQYQQPLSALVRDREAAANTLSLLRNKLEEARIAEAQVADTIRIADSAKVPETADSSPLATLAISGLAGLLLAAGVILLLETIDDQLHSAEDIEAVTGLPVFGTLPAELPYAPSLDSIGEFLQNSHWTEAYRLLFKALDFHAHSHPTGKPNVFVFSALHEEEGQVLSSAHLGTVAACLSRRSLIIDANWYNPLQHLYFSLSPVPGLSQMANHASKQADSTVSLQSVKASPFANLDVLPYGLSSPGSLADNVSETPAMQTLLAATSEQYDFTAVVAPSIETCADASALSSYGAGLVLVLQAHMTSKSLLARSLKKLEKSGTPVIGFVVAQTPDPIKLSAPPETARPFNRTENLSFPARITAEGRA